MGTNTKNGSFAITFDTAAVVTQVNVYATTIKTSASYTLSSYNDSNSVIASSTKDFVSDIVDGRCAYTGVSGDNNDVALKKLTFGTTSKNTIYVSKIEISIVTPAYATFDYGNVNDLANQTQKLESKQYLTEPEITTGYSFTDYEGTHTIEGWYTNLHDESTKFDFASTKVNDDITLYAKWVLSNETENSKNIKTSETKAQLNYTYKEGADVATITFGEKTGAGTKAGTLSYSYLSDEIDIKDITFNDKCYGSQKSDDNYALKMGSSSAIGLFTINFNSTIAIKGVNITASAWSGDTAKYQVYSNVNTTGKNIVFTNEGNPTTEYKWEDFTGDNDLDNGIGEKSSSITITGTNTSKGRAYISKIELIIATGETVSSDIPIYNISNIGLRFGGTVKKSYYEALESHIKNFGMVYTTKDKLGEYKTLTSALDAGVAESTFNVKTQEITDTIKPIEQTIGGEQYYVWNVFLNVSSSSLDKVIYAAGKLTLDNGTSFYLKERYTSVKDIASEYYRDDTAEYSDEVKATLELLADGKTKTDTTSSTDTSSSSSEEGE